MDEGRGWENENEKKKMILKLLVSVKYLNSISSNLGTVSF